MLQKGQSRTTLLASALLALLALLFTWQGTLGGKVFAPLELLSHFEPWRGVRAGEPPAWDVLLWDGTAQFYVWRELVRSMLLSGEMPYWNPYQFCGMPLLANSQSAPFYPLHLLALPLPTWLAMGWLAWFHLFWAGLGLMLCARREGLSLNASFLAGALWVFSTFFVAWLQLPSVPATMSWFGWVLLGVRLVSDEGVRKLWAFAVPTGMMLLAGHLQFAFYGILLVLLYSLYRAMPKFLDDRVSAGLFILSMLFGLGLAFCLASPQLLPVLELSGWSHRVSTPTEAGYEAYVRNALPLFHLIALWLPDVYGHPRNGSYWGAVHYAELALGIGTLGLVLAFASMARGRIVAFWWGVAVFALLLALGTPLLKLFYFLVPGGSATGSPARVLCLFALAMALLAGYGYDALSQSARAFWRGMVVYLIAGAIAIGLAFVLLPAGVPREPLTAGIGQNGFRSVALLVLASLLWLGFTQKRLSPQLFSLLLVFIAILEPFAQGYRYPLYAKREAVFPEVPLLSEVRPNPAERIATLNTRWSLYDAPPAVMPPNTSAMYRLYDVAGYDSLLPLHTKQVLDWINGTDSAPLENGNMQFVKRIHERLGWLRVKRVLTSDGWQEVPGNLSGVYLGRAQIAEQITPKLLDWAWRNGVVLLEPEEGQRALRFHSEGVSVPNAQIEWLDYRATRLRLRVTNPSNQESWLLLSDTYYPGWRARVNGKAVPLVRANHAFRAVPVPPGVSEVEMGYSPRLIAVVLPFVGAALLASVLFVPALIASARERVKQEVSAPHS